MLVGVMRLVAMISAHGGDGHMGIWPPDNPDAVHRFPVRLWEFPDGVYVTAARAPNGDLEGARVLKVDGIPIDRVFERLDPVVPRDTPSNLRAARMVFLTSAEVLTGLGIARRRRHDDARRRDGGRRAALRDDRGGGRGDVCGLGRRVGAVVARTPGARLPPGRAGAVPRRLPRERADARRPLPGRAGTQRQSSSAPIRAAMRDHAVERIVLDLRNNGGGEAGGFRELLAFLVDQHVPLVVLVGRLTFSAGSTLALHLERRVPDAVFIGETMGGAPSFWADPDTVTLPVLRPGGARRQPVQPLTRPRRHAPRGPTGHRGPVHLGRLLRRTRSGPGTSAVLTLEAGRLPWGPVVATIRSMKTSRRLLVVLAGACVFIALHGRHCCRADARRPLHHPRREHRWLGVQHGAAADAPRRRHRAVPDRDVHAIRAAVREGRGRPQGRPRRSRAPGPRAPAPRRRHLAGGPGRGGAARGAGRRRRARGRTCRRRCGARSTRRRSTGSCRSGRTRG